MAWLYFVRPIKSLLHAWQLKFPLSFLLASLVAALENALGVYQNLIGMPEYLIVAAAVAFMCDFFSAVLAAYRDEGLAGVQFIKFRQLLIKAAYWIIIIMAFSNMATAATKAGWPYFQLADEVAVFWLMLQDGWSTIVNWRGGEGPAMQWVSGALSLAKGDVTVEQIKEAEGS